MNQQAAHKPAGMAAAPVFSPQTYRTTGKPNIVVIVMDDLGYGQLNFDEAAHDPARLGHARASPRYAVSLDAAIDAARRSTPTLRRLQEEGVQLRNAFVAHAVSAPSRAALMTARSPSRFGVYGNRDAEQGVALAETFLPELLRNHGYHTAAIGKWHLSRITHQVVTPAPPSRDYHDNFVTYSDEPYQPQNRGFNEFFGFHGSGAAYYDSPSLFRNRERAAAVGYITEQLTDEAIRVVEHSGTQPFFLYLAYNAPHTPLEARAPEPYQIFDTGNPEVDNYYATVYAADQNIARLLATLEQTGKADNTLLVFLSDNGAVNDSPMPLNGQFRAHKGQTLQGGVHVPMFAHWPAGLAGGQTDTRLVSALDVMPTVLDAAGIAIPQTLAAKLEGVSLLPYWRGEKTGTPHDALYWVQPAALHWSEDNRTYWQDYHAWLQGKLDAPPANPHSEAAAGFVWTIRTSEWALHYQPDQAEALQLYALADSGEQHNLAACYPDVVRHLQQQIQDWLRAATPAVTRQNADKYEALLRSQCVYEW